MGALGMCILAVVVLVCVLAVVCTVSVVVVRLSRVSCPRVEILVYMHMHMSVLRVAL